MKFVAILFGLVAVVSAVKQEFIKLPEETLLKLQKIGAKCAAEHNVDPKLFSKITDGTLPRDDASNKYLYCFAVDSALVDEVGHIVNDKMVNIMGDHPLKKEFIEALNKCNEITKETRFATVMEMSRCYTETVPVLFAFEL